MKKNMIVGIALAMGILSVGAISASAAGSDATMVTCADKQAYQQFTKESAGLASAIKAKNIELREQYGYRDWEGYHEGIDVSKINELEAQLRALKNKVNAAAQKYDIPACSRS